MKQHTAKRQKSVCVRTMGINVHIGNRKQVWLVDYGHFFPKFTCPIIIKQGSAGVLGVKAFLCSPFLVFRNWASFSLHGLPSISKGQVQEVTLSGKEVNPHTREEQLRNSSTASGQDPGSFPRDTRKGVGI